MMKLPTKLNLVAGITIACSFVLLVGTYPLQWFGSGVVASTVWFSGLALIPISGTFAVVALGVGLKRGGKEYSAAIATSAFFLVYAAIGCTILFKWFNNFE